MVDRVHRRTTIWVVLLWLEKSSIGIRVAMNAKLSTAASVVNRQSAAQRELEEELRLLYVAATRARELLLVIGHAGESDWERARNRFAGAGLALPLITRLFTL